ncbi:hypothetical protein F7725_001218 [Dissostichus mawsoni]|uniref:Uncharacterized protein n=1 Tax=Dissostichus mawsoni TaxID=36200 RepID=A0A7J5ZH60_DISMA|nr:hypothetical protein F7725_001218 [Dissostichus mawsoni]
MLKANTRKGELLPSKRFHSSTKDAVLVIQFNLRAFFSVRTWPWMMLFYKLRPMLRSAQVEKELAVLKEAYNKLKEAFDRSEIKRVEAEERQVILVLEKDDLSLQLQATAAEKMCKVYEDQLNESRSRAEELQRQLTDVSTQKARAVTENAMISQLQRSKAGACQNAEDLKRQLEEQSKKLVVKLQNTEEAVESSHAKCSSLEKSKLSMQTEIEDLVVELERTNSAALALDKKQRNFDKMELQQIRSDIERKIAEKDEEIDNLRY